jgi:hypothetical protein
MTTIKYIYTDEIFHRCIRCNFTDIKITDGFTTENVSLVSLLSRISDPSVIQLMIYVSTKTLIKYSH